MANVFVDSNASGLNDGSTRANAYTTLGAALTAKAAGDDFWISSLSNESQGAVLTTLTSPGSIGTPCRIVSCVFANGTLGNIPVAADIVTGARVTTTGAFGITHAGFAHCYGVTFNCGSGAVTANLTLSTWTYESCAINIVATGGSCVLSLATGFTDLNNTTMSFGQSGQSVSAQFATFLRWRGAASKLNAGTAIPTTLFKLTASRSPLIVLQDVDLSLATGTIFGAIASSAGSSQIINCKLATGAVVAATPTAVGHIIDVVISDVDFAASIGYRQERYTYQGTLKNTITSYLNASDGQQSIAWSLQTTANSKWHSPFECPAIVQWNTLITGSHTATVEFTSATAALTNADVWVELEYFASGTSSQATVATSGTATTLTTGTALAASGVTWLGTTGSLGNKYSVPLTFAPRLAGYVRATIKVAKASLTIVADPFLTIA